MSQSRCLSNVIAAGLLILFVFATGLKAQSAKKTTDDKLLNMVPAESLFCIRVNNFEYTLSQIDQFLTGASPMPMGVSMLVRMQFANLLGSPELNGVNMNGSMLLFGANLPSESPQTNPVSNMFVGVLFPVTDYKQFLDGNPNCTQPDEKGISKITSNETPIMLATQAGNYTLVSWANDYDKLIAYKKLMGIGTSASAETTPFASALDTTEAKQATTEPIWAYGNVQLASKIFGPILFGKIEEIKTKMQSIEADQQVPMIKNMQNIINIYVSIIETLMKETRSVSIVINPKPNVLNITKTICAVPGTDMANIFVADTVAEKENKLLGYLEDGAMMNFGLRVNATIDKKINEKSIELFSILAGESMTAEDIAKMKALAADGIDCLGGPVAGTISIDVKNKPPFLVKYFIAVKNEKEFNQFIEEAVQMINTSGILDFYKSMGMETTFSINRNIDRYKDVQIDSAKFAMKSTDPNSPQGQMITMMYGEGLNYRWAMVDGLWVCALGGDVDTAIRQLIDKAKAGTPKQSSAEIKAALALLPEVEKADFMMTCNLLRLFKMATAMAPIPMPQMDIATKSNIVLAAKAGNSKMVVNIAVPKEHITEIMSIFQMMMQQKQQQQPQTETKSAFTPEPKLKHEGTESAGASEENGKVEYSYTSFPSYSERQKDGSLGLPEEKVVFGEEMQAEHALAVKVGDSLLTCPLAYQDVAYLFDNGEKHTVRILAYKGCPFQVKELSVEKDIVLREETTIIVDSTHSDVLQLAKDSCLPFAANQSGLVFMCTSVVNVIWKFPREGMTFETEDAIYTTTKAGASIGFSKDGIKIDGIDKKVKISANQ